MHRFKAFKQATFDGLQERFLGYVQKEIGSPASFCILVRNEKLEMKNGGSGAKKMEAPQVLERRD